MGNYHGPGVYEHYKGGQYRVFGLALEPNTVVKSGEPRFGMMTGVVVGDLLRWASAQRGSINERMGACAL